MQQIEATLAEVFSHAEQQQQPTQTIEEQTVAARRQDSAGLQAIAQHVNGLAALRGEMQSKLGLDDRPALLAATHVMFHAGARRRGGVPFEYRHQKVPGRTFEKDFARHPGFLKCLRRSGFTQCFTVGGRYGYARE